MIKPFFSLLGGLSVFLMGMNFAQAGCEARYREATLKLANEMKAFNQGELSHAGLLFEFGEIEAAILAGRLECHAETIEQQQCVLKYKAVYHELRDQINVYDLVTERQGIEFRAGILGKQGRLTWVDAQCRWFQ